MCGTAAKLAWIAAVWLACAATVACAFERLPSQYRIQRWGVSDGLPSSSIRTVLLDDAGFLWIGTDEGLARFDGREFRTWTKRDNSAFPVDEVRKLSTLPDGRLLIAFHASLVAFDGTHFTPLIKFDAGTNLLDMLRLADGSALVAGNDVWRVAADFGSAEKLYEGGQLYSWLTPTSAGLFLVNEQWVIEVLPGGGVLGRRWPLAGGSVGDFVVATEIDGVLHIASQSRSWRLPLAALPPVATLEADVAALPLSPVTSIKGPEGLTWVSGLGKVSGLARGESLARPDRFETIALPASNVTSLALDRTGALWVGTWRDGLFRVSAPGVLTFGAEENAALAHVRSLHARTDGSVLLVTQTNAVEVRGTALRNIELLPLRSSGDAYQGANTLADGRTILIRKVGLDVATPDGAWSRLDAEKGADAQEQVYASHVDRGGAVWLGVRGIARLQNGSWGRATGLDALVHAFAEGAGGELWASGQDGIYRNDRPGSLAFARVPEAVVPKVTFLSALKDSTGQFWFGSYQGGLYRLRNGEWRHYSTQDGLPSDTADSVLEDQRGHLWISHARGLYSIQPEEFARHEHEPGTLLRYKEYTRSDGLRSDRFNGGTGFAGAVDRDGRLWFVNEAGAVRVDPQKLGDVPAPPAAHIDSIDVDGAAMPRDLLRLVLAADAQHTSIRVVSPAPGIAERYRLRWRMPPDQPDWLAVSDDGVIEFDRLAPGQRVLEVATLATDGRTSAVRRLELEQTPHWYQRAWVWLAGAFATALLIWLSVRWWIRALRLRAAHLEAMVAERGEQLAEEHRRLTEADSALREAEREVRWHRLNVAQGEWATVDPMSRLVYAALARHTHGSADLPQLASTVASEVPSLRDIPAEELGVALQRLQGSGAVIQHEQRWATNKPDWAALPDLALSLNDLALMNARRIGAYRLLERIGSGGTAEVFRAINVHDASEAAVKLLHAEIGRKSEAARRLRREGEIVAGLSHPNLIKLLARGDHDGRLYIAMELVVGETLAAHHARIGTLDLQKSIQIAHELASALAALHVRDVVHRDVTPSNVMIERTTGRTVLLDLGLARGAQQSMLTRPQTILGTLPYMSPEQLRGETCDASSDVFSLGVVVYELLSGQRPWRRENTIEIALEIGQWDGNLDLEGIGDPTIAALLIAMLAPCPDARPTAMHVASVLEGSLRTTRSLVGTR